MASYVDNGNKLDWALSFQRTGNFPIDRSSMFSSYADAVKYAKGDSTDPDSRGLQGSSYVGQIIAVYENNTVNIYKIDADRTLSSVGSGGGSVSAYADLPDKPSINNVELVGNKTSANLGLQPAGDYALRSEIPDVSNFITVTVDNLVNYYLKSETYNKQEVNSLISAISTATFELVNELPQTGESNVIYLVPSSNPGTQNVKDEYIWINNSWEQIGSTSVDLTGYATETWVNTQIANFLTQAQIELLINTAISVVNSSIANINSKISNQASANNQLADKLYVDTAISTATATFRGTFTNLATLQATEGDRNDYAYYSHQDTAGNTLYDRYKYVGLPESRVPADYTEMLSLTKPQNAQVYINTGYKIRSTDRIYAKCYGFEYAAKEASVFGATDSNNKRFRLRKGYMTGGVSLQSSSGSVGVGSLYNNQMIIEAYDGKVYASNIDGSNTQLKGNLTLEDVDANLYLFVENGDLINDDLNFYTQWIRLGDFIVYDSEGNKKLELVPCQNNQGVNGYYDTVSGTFKEPTGGTLNAQAISTDKWLFEYDLSNLILTSAQWSTLNSGLVAHVTATGYDATKTQVLKNINGTLTWVTEE